MKIKSFKHKRKIILAVFLSVVLAANFFGMNKSVLAMVGDDSSPDPVRVVPVNPFINIPNEDGWTLLMQAIREHDPEGVKKLLEQGADLTKMPPDLIGLYSNGLEYLCSLVVRTGSGKFVDGEYEEKNWLLSEEVRQSYYDIFDIIIQHFIDHKIRCSMDMSKLANHSDTIYTVWDCYAKWQYWEKIYDYPQLFS